MIYKILVEEYQKIEDTSKRLEMTDLLVELLKNTSVEDIEKVIYLTEGKLRPDYEGIELGLAEKLALKAISEAYGRDIKEVESLYLKVGDLGSVAEQICSAKSQKTLLVYVQEEPKLTIDKVYNNFMSIASSSGQNSQARKLKLFEELLNLADPLEAKYLTRTVVGKLRLGIADKTIIDSLSVYLSGSKDLRDEIERVYSIYPDLGKIAEILIKNGIEGIKHINIEIGVPVMSMLAERLPSLDEIIEKMGGVAAYEYKYDGLRLQVHVSKNKNVIYSRRLENITAQFPDILNYINNAFIGESAILDGEGVPVDPNTNQILPFQAVSHRRGRKYELTKAQEEYPVVLFLFDILYLNGEDLTMKPYTDRRALLIKNIKETDDIKIAQQTVSADKEEINRFFEKAIEDGCEGVVSKNVTDQSVYRAGAREFLWVKYKRDYQLSIEDTVDLVVLGAFSGRGYRKGTYGALLMGSYNDKDDSFETVCKLGSGFTDDQLFALPNLLKSYLLTHKHPRVVSGLESDYWFEPSIVLELKGAEITISPSHTCCKDLLEKGAGLSIRFPRFTGKYRSDKSAEEATTSQEILDLYHHQLKKFNNE
jgi:DNA ligase-1